MALQARNYPPPHGIIVSIEHQQRVIRDLLGTTAIRPSDADYLTERLLANDTRCLYSHGSRQLTHYIENLNEEKVNPEPDIQVVSDFGAVCVVDGDGGLGYMACRIGIDLVLAKAREFGVGACSTGNHFHIGSAGAWTRMAVEAGCAGLTMSAHRNSPAPEKVVMSLVNSSPISIGFPSGDQPPFILDMGGSFLGASNERMKESPNAFFKALGLSAAIQMFSGVLAGIYQESRIPPRSKWSSNQGAFLCAWDVSRFMDADEFRAQMDAFIGHARAMEPFPGFNRAELPGGMEFEWERQNKKRGLFALGDDHRQQLEELAREVGVDCGYEAFEESRF
ncbi:MAG: Ldh family oxidoreductase [Candidatus Latescibacterota bacterium]|nr:Ldh family oxidoreductase [Candidatus Latescibacterota bacterium]